MIGKNGRKRGNGFYSKILRMSLLIILGLVVFECQAKPAEPSIGKNEVKDSPLDPPAVQETKDEVYDGVSDALSLLETRLKRSATTDSTNTKP